MATQAQILANRCNAQQSTGPATPEGKAAVAKNATKHGLFARCDVVISENQADFDALRAEMLHELSPEGTIETLLAGRIVSLTWRLRRAARMQNELIDVRIRLEINDSEPLLSKSLITGQPCRLSENRRRCYDDVALGLVAKWDFGGDRTLERLSMYERRLEASLFKTMAELKKIQRMRQSEQGEDRSAIPPLGKAATHRQTQGRDALATQCAKQSQSAADREELSAFEKREYELLLGAAPTPDKANPDVHRDNRRRQTEDGGQKVENSLRRKVMVCRY